MSASSTTTRKRHLVAVPDLQPEPQTIPCQSWCDDHDPDGEVCRSAGFRLDFGRRGWALTTEAIFSLAYAAPNKDNPGNPPLEAYIVLDGNLPSFTLEPDQLAPMAYALLALKAAAEGQDEAANDWARQARQATVTKRGRVTA
jgi:hypothetical protein